MQIQITGKNLDIGDALREHVENRINNDVAKYFDGIVRAHVIVEKQRSGFDCEITLHLTTGLVPKFRLHGEILDVPGAEALDEKTVKLTLSRRVAGNELPAVDLVFGTDPPADSSVINIVPPYMPNQKPKM